MYYYFSKPFDMDSIIGTHHLVSISDACQPAAQTKNRESTLPAVLNKIIIMTCNGHEHLRSMGRRHHHRSPPSCDQKWHGVWFACVCVSV